MSTSKKKSGRYLIACDVKKCGQTVSSIFGRDRALEMAEAAGWYVASERVARGRKNHAAMCPVHNNMGEKKR